MLYVKIITLHVDINNSHAKIYNWYIFNKNNDYEKRIDRFQSIIKLDIPTLNMEQKCRPAIELSDYRGTHPMYIAPAAEIIWSTYQ